MKSFEFIYTIIFLSIFSFNSFSQSNPGNFEKLNGKQFDKLSVKTIESIKNTHLFSPKKSLKIDSAFIDKKNEILDIYFPKSLSYYKFRENTVKKFTVAVRNAQKHKIRKKYTINCLIDSLPLYEYIPDLYRKTYALDSSRFEKRKKSTVQHVKNTDIPFKITKGLENRHITVWGGHGYYYSQKNKVWMWQRPNLYTTVEGMENLSYIVPYIIPMLENAGANVYYPKERDFNSDEYIIDIDNSRDKITMSANVKEVIGGFLLKDYYTDHENPFKEGNHLEMKSSKLSNKKDSVVYRFQVKKAGNYAVYVSYFKRKDNVSKVKYTVYHAGGKTDFAVNQQMGYSTWVYLGTFHFNEKKSKVVVYNTSEEAGTISSDAVKIGGGYTRIMRNGLLSPKPAYMNGARYYLQYAGMPDTAVYSLSKYTSDYKDDYRSRGEWVNYLTGGIYCHNRDSSIQGLNIPIDVSLSFHTDAGDTKNDSIIGTLAIHSTKGLKNERFFPDGRSRFASRDLCDIIETEVIKTLRSKYRNDWTSREIWDKKYSEATYPNIPSVLIELLSHENFEDEKFSLNPNFKFDASRAIYKGILKFIAYYNKTDYVVTPLPVKDFSINYKNKKFILSWEETIDKSEETAKPNAYIVYTKINDGGFNNGVLVKNKKFIFDKIKKGEIYSFKIKAVNKGGMSFDSEILSGCINNFEDTPILIVNGFSKVSSPDFVDTDSIGGFAYWNKSAVASGTEYSFTGFQYSFNKNDAWKSDFFPGHGASFSDYEEIRVVGNTFDYPYRHGKQFANLQLSFISTSAEAFEQNPETFSHFKTMDLIYGKQSNSMFNKNLKLKNYEVFSPAMRNALDKWLDKNKAIVISGAFIGKDVFLTHGKDSVRSNWVKNKLQYSVYSTWACQTGEVSGKNELLLSKKPSEEIYELRSVDALKPENGAKILYRYKENDFPACVIGNKNGYKVLSFGFPLESVIKNQDKLFKQITELLGLKN